MTKATVPKSSQQIGRLTRGKMRLTWTANEVDLSPGPLTVADKEAHY